MPLYSDGVDRGDEYREPEHYWFIRELFKKRNDEIIERLSAENSRLQRALKMMEPRAKVKKAGD